MQEPGGGKKTPKSVQERGSEGVVKSRRRMGYFRGKCVGGSQRRGRSQGGMSVGGGEGCSEKHGLLKTFYSGYPGWEGERKGESGGEGDSRQA